MRKGKARLIAALFLSLKLSRIKVFARISRSAILSECFSAEDNKFTRGGLKVSKNESRYKKLLVAAKISTVVYVFLLAGIIFLADRRGTDHLLSFVGRIAYGDKVGHFLLAGGLSLLVNLSCGARTVSFSRARILLGSLIVGAFFLLEEISQIFIGSRTFDWADLIFDFAGIVVFGKAARLILRRRSGRDFSVEKI